MQQAVCKCLNLGVKLVDSVQQYQDDQDESSINNNYSNSSISQPITVQQKTGQENVKDLFFSSADGPHLIAARLSFDLTALIEKLPTFIEKRSFNGWCIKRCVMCDSDVYASSLSCPGRILVDSALLKNPIELASLRNSPDYSLAFDVVLPKLLFKSFNTNFALPPTLVHSVNSVVSQRLRKERHDLETKIQNFVDKETAKFEQFKSKAKQDEELILALASMKCCKTTAVSTSKLKRNEVGLRALDAPSDAIMMAVDHDTGSVSGGAAVIDDEQPWEEQAPSAVAAAARLSSMADEPYDSGVPVSPGSARWSPAIAQNLSGDDAPQMAVAVEDDDDSVATLKSQATLPLPKRKRHSGGTGGGKPPAFLDRAFFDGFESAILPDDNDDDMTGPSDATPMMVAANALEMSDQFDENYAADESSDSDNFVATTISKPMAVNMQTLFNSDDRQAAALCRSLPVAIRGAAALLVDSPSGGDDDAFASGNDNSSGTVLDSMAALARSLRPHDDPEVLFGARPQRRRVRSALDAAAVTGGEAVAVAAAMRLETVDDEPGDDMFY